MPLIRVCGLFTGIFCSWTTQRWMMDRWIIWKGYGRNIINDPKGRTLAHSFYRLLRLCSCIHCLQYTLGIVQPVTSCRKYLLCKYLYLALNRFFQRKFTNYNPNTYTQTVINLKAKVANFGHKKTNVYISGLSHTHPELNTELHLNIFGLELTDHMLMHFFILISLLFILFTVLQQTQAGTT